MSGLTGPLGGRITGAVAGRGRRLAIAPLETVAWYVDNELADSGNSHPTCAVSLSDSMPARNAGPSFIGMGIDSVEGI